MAEPEWRTVQRKKAIARAGVARVSSSLSTPPAKSDTVESATKELESLSIKPQEVANTRSEGSHSHQRPRLLRDKLLNDGALVQELPHSVLTRLSCRQASVGRLRSLNLKKDVLLEVAILVTTEQLKVIDEGIELVIRTDKAILEGMDEWCTEHHGNSGLTQRCIDSTLTMAEAEDRIVEYTAKHFPTGSALLAGSSVHVDKTFIVKDMPRWADQLHYRVLDVSTVRELCARWYPRATDRPDRGVVAHRALSDIKSSIEDLKYFRRIAFK